MKRHIAVINLNIDPETKDQAQTIADELGLSLSALIRVCLKEVIRTKRLPGQEASEPL